MTARGNQFNPQTGNVEGDHLAQLVKFQFGDLLHRVAVADPHGLRLVDSDLPKGVRTLMEQSAQLAAQLERCDSVDLDTAEQYCTAQSRLAAKALPLLIDALTKRQGEADSAVAKVRQTLADADKARSPLLGDLADSMVKAGDLQFKAERSAKLPAWRTVAAIVRDLASQKTAPRWLQICKGQHEAYRASGVMPDYTKVAPHPVR